jgi:hypothetical protein
MRSLLPLATTLLLTACAATPPETAAPTVHAAAAPSGPPSWPTPEGWRAEQIPFPLKFAPDLAYRGVEELRFAPRFFKPDAETYFTYSFAFVIDPDARGVVPFAVDRFAGDLRGYFTGLMAAVTGAPADPTAHDAHVVATGDRFTGTVRTFDGFSAKRTGGAARPLRLHLAGETFRCGARRVIVASLSPRAPSDAIWPALAAQRGAFRCDTGPLNASGTSAARPSSAG